MGKQLIVAERAHALSIENDAGRILNELTSFSPLVQTWDKVRAKHEVNLSFILNAFGVLFSLRLKFIVSFLLKLFD